LAGLADQLALTRNRPAGFDYMRIALATTIICLHGANVTLQYRESDDEYLACGLRSPAACVGRLVPSPLLSSF
jgi:hypothetical protein